MRECGENEIAGQIEKSFSCSTDNIKSISDILTTLTAEMSRDQPCYVDVSNSELNFIVAGKAKSMQARLALNRSMFEEFECDADSIKFAINLTVLLDCLRIFGSSDSTTATMSFSTADELLNISLEESSVVTTCEINSLYTEDFNELDQQSLFIAFRNNQEECQIILKSEPLREVIQELTDSFWTGIVKVSVSNNPAAMKFLTGGQIGASEINIPRTSEAFVSFQSRSNISFEYSLKSLMFGMKALSVSKEVYIRINSEGLMCIQHLIETSSNKETFLDFLMVAEIASE
jgi:cell cycle checkpoint protein